MKFSNLSSRLIQALREDAAFSDITTRQISARSKRCRAKLIAREKGIFCGSFLLLPLFRLLDKSARAKVLKKDGASVNAGQTLAILHGKTSALLSGERTYLNLACHLSGIATLTNAYTKAVSGTKAKILDTRKTTPLWRDLEKFAVKCGGGENHRFSLADAILVKDNHVGLLRSAGISISNVFHRDRFKSFLKKRGAFLEMEASSYRDVWDAIKSRVDVILLDNMPRNRIKGSIEFVKAARSALNSQKPLIEVSGGVTIQQARELAELGVDRISVGALTHSAPALDLSMEVF